MILRRVAIAQVVLDALEQVCQLGCGLDLDVVMVLQAVLHTGEELELSQSLILQNLKTKQN